MSLHNSHFKDTPLQICVIDVIFIEFLHIFVKLTSLFKTTSQYCLYSQPASCKHKTTVHVFWQFNYDAPLTLYNILSAAHRASVIIKNVRTSFKTSDTQLLDALCDANVEGKHDVRQRCSKLLWRKKSWLTQSTVIKLPVNQGFQVTEVKLCVGHCWRLSS